MLRRSRRIHGRDAVSAALTKGESAKNGFFVIRKLKNNLDRNRYAIVISKKLEKSAVKRNKKRRQIYEIVRQLEKKSIIDISSPSDIVLLARKPAAHASFDDLNKAVAEILTAKTSKNS